MQTVALKSSLLSGRSTPLRTTASEKDDGLSPNLPKALRAWSTLFIVDSRLHNSHALAIGLHHPCWVLSPQREGIGQITEILHDQGSITDLHIICQDDPGCLYLGSTSLSMATMADYATHLRSWFTATATSAIPPLLLLYGNDVATGESGRAFTQCLHWLTGANIITPVRTEVKTYTH